jgi:hypothetical protein
MCKYRILAPNILSLASLGEVSDQLDDIAPFNLYGREEIVMT